VMWGICYEWKGFKISEKSVSVYGVKPAESVKSWRRQWGWVNGESGEDKVVI